MKLLICTQVVDKNHPILGFFHRWIEEFSKHSEAVHVICLYEGEHSLPSNVHVHSLGKESGESRVKYLLRFYRYVWQLRHEYDAVFVHMNQIYVILGAPLWRLLGKQIGLWYAHGKVSASLKVAEKLTDLIFTSTEEGLQLQTPKRRIVGQGIDLDHFTYKERTPNPSLLRLVTVGRISKSKNIGTLIDACAILKEQGTPFTFRIVGIAISEEEKQYEREMREKVTRLNLDEQVEWVGAVSQKDLPGELHKADVFIHDGATQSLDKALLEAVACGCVVVSSNQAYRALTESIASEYLYSNQDYKQLAYIIMNMSFSDYRSVVQVRTSLKESHSIAHLISKIKNELIVD